MLHKVSLSRECSNTGAQLQWPQFDTLNHIALDEQQRRHEKFSFPFRRYSVRVLAGTHTILTKIMQSFSSASQYLYQNFTLKNTSVIFFPITSTSPSFSPLAWSIYRTLASFRTNLQTSLSLAIFPFNFTENNNTLIQVITKVVSAYGGEWRHSSTHS